MDLTGIQARLLTNLNEHGNEGVTVVGGLPRAAGDYLSQLVKRGFVRCSSFTVGHYQRTNLVISDTGRDALQSWREGKGG